MTTTYGTRLLFFPVKNILSVGPKVAPYPVSKKQIKSMRNDFSGSEVFCSSTAMHLF